MYSHRQARAAEQQHHAEDQRHIGAAVCARGQHGRSRISGIIMDRHRLRRAVDSIRRLTRLLLRVVPPARRVGTVPQRIAVAGIDLIIDHVFIVDLIEIFAVRVCPVVAAACVPGHAHALNLALRDRPIPALVGFADKDDAEPGHGQAQQQQDQAADQQDSGLLFGLGGGWLIGVGLHRYSSFTWRDRYKSDLIISNYETGGANGRVYRPPQ